MAITKVNGVITETPPTQADRAERTGVHIDSDFALCDENDVLKQMKFNITPMAAGKTVTLEAGAGSSDVVITLPSASGTLVTTANNGASNALDNLAAVAINTSLISDTDNTDDLGSAAKNWKDVYAKTVQSSTTLGLTTDTQSGVTATGNVTLASGNQTGTGNSGDISITAGTAPGGTRGSITLTSAADKVLLAAGPGGAVDLAVSSVKYVNDGLSGRANVLLSNLTDNSVAINTSLVSDTDNTDDLGSASKNWKDVHAKTVQSSTTLGLTTDTQSGATLTGVVTIATGNQTGTAASGNMSIATGTAVGETAETGAITIATGNQVASAPGDFIAAKSGTITISSGQSDYETTGAVTITTGSANGVGTYGVGSFPGHYPTGSTTITTGAISGNSNSDTGAVIVASGANSGSDAGAGSGDVTVKSGNSTNSGSGNVSIASGSAVNSGSRGTVTLDSAADKVLLAAQPTGGTDLAVATTKFVNDGLAGKQATGSYITSLTSDVTASGPGAAAATIANSAVTNAKMANMADNTIKGNKSGGAAAPSDLALSDVAEATSSVLTISNGTKAIVGASNLTIQVAQATTSTSGYLSNTDWNTFNNKQAAGTYLTPVNLVVVKNAGTLTANTDIGSWSTAEIDSASAFNTTSGVYTVPSAGVYSIQFIVGTTTAAAAALKIMLGGAVVVYGMNANVSRFNIATSVKCAQNDTLSFQIDSTLTANSDNTSTRLCINKVG